MYMHMCIYQDHTTYMILNPFYKYDNLHIPLIILQTMS
jgi:hypothetical protein